MNIGYDAKRAFFNRSGLGNYSRSIIQNMSRFYHLEKYHLYTPSLKNSISFDIPESVDVISPANAFDKHFKSYWRTFRMWKSIKNNNIDLFHGLSNELPVNIKKSKAKSIVTIHDLIFLRHPEFYKPIDRLIYSKKFKHACQNADKIIAVSQQTKHDIINFFGIDENKISVVYQTCNPLFTVKNDEKIKLFIKNKYKLPEKYILNVGTIEERKNIFSVVKALHHSHIDIPLIIVGKPTHYTDMIKEYVTRHKMEQKVVFYHHVETDDLPVFYQMAELFIYPSFFEGFGIPIIEALFSKVPVITTNGGCFPEAGGKYSIYVKPDNTDEIKEAIIKVLHNSELKNKMISEGYAHALNFKGEKIAKDLMNVYLSILKQ